MAANSSSVPLFLSVLALLLTIQQFDRIYPIEGSGSMRSRLGLCGAGPGPLPVFGLIGIPRIGHLVGILTSAAVIAKGTPSRFARYLASRSMAVRGLLARAAALLAALHDLHSCLPCFCAAAEHVQDRIMGWGC
jgi:hypothetical protein